MTRHVISQGEREGLKVELQLAGLVQLPKIGASIVRVSRDQASVVIVQQIAIFSGQAQRRRRFGANDLVPLSDRFSQGANIATATPRALSTSPTAMRFIPEGC